MGNQRLRQPTGMPIAVRELKQKGLWAHPIGEAIATGAIGATTLATYTAPAGKRAKVQSMQGHIVRVIAATTASVATIRLTWNNQDGASAGGVAIARIAGNAVGDKDSMSFTFGGDGVELKPAQGVSLVYEDGSTGGSVIYRGGIDIEEFDME